MASEEQSKLTRRGLAAVDAVIAEQGLRVVEPKELAAQLRGDAADVRRRIETLGLPMQAVHGDAHLDNAINTVAGPLWNDWEDACLAPRALDLGCMEAAASVWGDDPEPVAAALAAYGEID